MSELRQREPRVKDGAHLNRIRQCPCCICGSIDVQAAHIRTGSIEYGKKPTGMGEKPDDKWTLPLCTSHHREQHTMNEMEFWAEYGINPFALACTYYQSQPQPETTMSNVETTITHVGAQPPPPAGHNTATGSPSVPKETVTGSATGRATSSATGATKVAADQLKSVVARIEQLEDEKSVLGVDISDIYKEAKGNGFDVKALRTIVRLRKMNPDDRAEQETILDTYMLAMGMI